MRKVLVVAALSLMVLGHAGAAKADSVTMGGITYSFKPVGTPAPGEFLVEMSISAMGALSAATLNSFSLQFTNASSVSLALTPAGTGDWVTQIGLVNTTTGCSGTMSATWCFDGGSIPVPSSGPSSSGTYDFIFDVSSLTAPTKTQLTAFQPLGPTSPLAINATVAIGAPPTTTPEPGSILLLGLGLAGSSFIRRRRS